MWKNIWWWQFQDKHPQYISLDQKKLDNAEYFNYLGSLVTNAARCTCEIKSRIAMAKATFNKMTFQEQHRLKFMEEWTSEILYLGHGSLWCQTFDTLEDQKYLEKFWNVLLEKGGADQLDQTHEKWYISKDQGGKNILHTTKWWKANWNGHILHRNCILKHVIQGKIEGQGRRGGRCKQLLDDLMEMRRYWKLKEEAHDSSLWRMCFEGGYGPLAEDRWWCCWW